MNKIKFFTGNAYSDLEKIQEDINKWVAENPSVCIENTSVSQYEGNCIVSVIYSKKTTLNS